MRTGQLQDFYVPDQVTVRRAITLLGPSSRSQARCAVRVAPVNNPFEWPLAHPVVVALDPAQDAGRGREILSAWTQRSERHAFSARQVRLQRRVES